MLYAACKDDKSVRGDLVQFERVQSNLKLTSGELPVLSLLKSPGRHITSYRTPVAIV